VLGCEWLVSLVGIQGFVKNIKHTNRFCLMPLPLGVGILLMDVAKEACDAVVVPRNVYAFAHVAGAAFTVRAGTGTAQARLRSAPINAFHQKRQLLTRGQKGHKANGINTSGNVACVGFQCSTIQAPSPHPQPQRWASRKVHPLWALVTPGSPPSQAGGALAGLHEGCRSGQ
jgi:hypothetical protein